MSALHELIGTRFERIKITNAGNIYVSPTKKTCLLKPTDRVFDGASKKPIYYLSSLEQGKSTYLSGLFATDDPSTFSCDYLDALCMKHIVKIRFSDGGKVMTIAVPNAK